MYGNYDQDPYKSGGGFMPSNYAYGQPQSQPGQQELVFKQILMAEDIKEIVSRLNTSPFAENLTLVTFDELQP